MPDAPWSPPTADPCVGRSGYERLFGEIYNAFEDTDEAIEYARRHNISAQAVLTVTNDELAHNVAEVLGPRIEGKTVVEIGGGIGLLSLHMGPIAKRVYCIEANPMWSWVFATILQKTKPKNVSFLMGAADEFLGLIKADVAVFLTHSGVQSMSLVAAQFAPVVIDFYSELVASNPDAFDPLARELRKYA